MSRSWGRLYAGTRNHRKIKILAARLPALWPFWYVLIDLAIEIDDGGWIYVSPGNPYTFKELAKELRIKREDHVKTFCKALEELNLITISDKGILLNSFSERNFESDISTPRVQKYRERQKQAPNSETLHERTGNVSETHQNKDRTDTDTDTDNPPIVPPKVGTVFSLQDLAKLWNEKAPPELSRVNLPFSRGERDMQKIRTVVKRHPDMMWWENVIVQLFSLPFVRGANDRGWKITLDVMVRDAEKILDGKYAPGSGPTAKMQGRWAAGQRFIERGRHDG